RDDSRVGCGVRVVARISEATSGTASGCSGPLPPYRFAHAGYRAEPSCAGLTRATIKNVESTQYDGLPGQACPGRDSGPGHDECGCLKPIGRCSGLYGRVQVAIKSALPPIDRFGTGSAGVPLRTTGEARSKAVFKNLRTGT